MYFRIKKLVSGIILVLLHGTCPAQTAFFKSDIPFSDGDLSPFYAALSIAENHLFFIANDYKLHTYNASTGASEWEYDIGRKTTTKPFFVNGKILTAQAVDGVSNAVFLELQTGKTKVLNVGIFETEPILKDHFLLGTAIDNGGRVVCYDLKTDTISWSRFVAHGVSKRPYYGKDKITANAENDYWFDLSYTGILSDTTCEPKATIFVEDIPCIRRFDFKSHDGFEIPQLFFFNTEYGDEAAEHYQIVYAKENTLLYSSGKLVVLGKKGKFVSSIEIASLQQESGTPSTYAEILKVEENKVWLCQDNLLLIIDFKKKKQIAQFDLQQWMPYFVVMQQDKVWLISKKDGQLYGITL